MATSVTSLRNPIDDLTSKLNQEPTKPVGTLEQEFGAMAQRGARAREITPEILSQTQQAERNVIEPIMRQRESRATESKQMFERQAADTAGMEQKYAAMRPEPIEFAPSKETSENLQNIAISMMLVGAIAGGASKRSGIAGLKAMKGMVDGYRQGRKDIFDKEKTIFEKALETQKQKIEEIKSLYESEARARLAGNQAEANGLKAMIEAETANGTLNIALAQRNTDQVLSQLQAVSQGYSKGLEGLANLKKAEEDRRARAAEREMRLRDFKVIGQDEQGNVVMANDVGQTRTMTGVKPSGGGAGRVGQNNLMFAGRVHSNIIGAAKDLAGVASLPGSSQSPVLSGMINRDPETVTGSLVAAAGRKMTDLDKRAFDQVANSLDLALTKIEGQGLASSATKFNVQQYSALRPRAGDQAINMAIYLAKVRQEIETGVLSHSRMAGATPEQKQDLQNILKDVEKTIPFTLDDVTEVLRRGRMRLDEKTQKTLNLPSVTDSAIRAGSENLRADMPSVAPTMPQQSAKPMPNETKLKAYADANFQGDIEAARSFLSSQGYK